MYVRAYDTVAVIAYHATSDPFYCGTDGGQRWTYYGNPGTPQVHIDGNVDSVYGGTTWPGTLWPVYRVKLNTRLAASTPIRINLTCTYDSIANTGTVTATVYNDSAGALTLVLQCAVIENEIPYAWGTGQTTVEHVCRDMLPDGNGESITITGGGGNVVRTRNFTIDATWNEKKCYIVAFVQRASNKFIYQGNMISIMNTGTNMDYYGLTFTEQSGNINRVAQPGETVRLYIKGCNKGGGSYTGGATLSESDAYITINSQTPQTTAIQAGDVDTVIIADVAIAAGCPTPRYVPFVLNWGTAGDRGMDTVRFIVTNQTGLSDNVESGTNGWSHSGYNDSIHITMYRSHSATHSWLLNRETGHIYTSNNDASLFSPYFVVTPDSSLKFWHTYWTEAGYDYVYCEIDNNSGWWQSIGNYNGTLATWTQQTIPLTAYAGQTVRLRWRFLSDYNVNAEGYYLDDIMVPVVLIGVDENKTRMANSLLSVSPRIFKSGLNIQWSSSVQPLKLGIYDASGRLVKSISQLGTGQATWNGIDDAGNGVATGTYFVRIETQNGKQAEKVLFLK